MILPAVERLNTQALCPLGVELGKMPQVPNPKGRKMDVTLWLFFAAAIALVVLILSFYAVLAVAVGRHRVSIRTRQLMERITDSTFISLGGNVALTN